MTGPQTYADVFARHARIGFQFSGGRDSTAALHVLRPFWPRMAIYTVDTGDRWPETVDVIRDMERLVGRPFTVIESNAPAYWRVMGRPSDVVPANRTPIGMAIKDGGEPVSDRFACCMANLMRPMHERMAADGITLIVRGTRAADYEIPPVLSGDNDGCFEYLYPVESWSDEQVNQYIEQHGLPLSPVYAEGSQHGSDCLHCTAWWDDGRLPYLSRHYPVVFKQFERHIALVREAIADQFKPLTEGAFHG